VHPPAARTRRGQPAGRLHSIPPATSSAMFQYNTFESKTLALNALDSNPSELNLKTLELNTLEPKATLLSSVKKTGRASFTWRYRQGIFGPRHLPGGDIKMTVMNIGEPGRGLQSFTFSST